MRMLIDGKIDLMSDVSYTKERAGSVLFPSYAMGALNERVFVDALTSVRNKGAYADHIQKLQERLDLGVKLEFAIGVFDIDNLKLINGKYGRDKGDQYIIAAAHLICQTFKHSLVFRIGGDEFAAILQNDDYQNREALVEQFRQARDAGSTEGEIWTQPRVSMGLAAYDPELDSAVEDTMRRADKVMYENKHARKAGR